MQRVEAQAQAGAVTRDLDNFAAQGVFGGAGREIGTGASIGATTPPAAPAIVICLGGVLVHDGFDGAQLGLSLEEQ